ncbi:hypothetical protein F9K33_07275 [bacterium]|nr:MAG: hypothetical protein F9K33_07275 [bacterium]
MRILFLTIAVLSGTNLFSQELNYSSDEEKTILVNKAFRDSTDICKLIMVSEGINDSVKWVHWQSSLKMTNDYLKSEIKPKYNIEKKARIIYAFLHKNIFRKYIENTRLSKIFIDRTYNCFTASVLFYQLCGSFSIPVTLYASPTHIYPVVTTEDGNQVKVEMTDAVSGYDSKEDKEETIKFLLRYKFITTDELKSKGIDAVYNEFVDRSEPAHKDKVLAISYSNLGVSYLDEQKNSDALSSFEKAVFLDSSNQKFSQLYRLTFGEWCDRLSYKNQFVELESVLTRGLEMMHRDTVFVAAVLPLLGNVINYYVADRFDFVKGQKVLEKTRLTIPQDSSLLKQLANYDRTLSYNWAISDYNKGNYKKAFEKIESLYLQNVEDSKVTETYVNFGCHYANSLSRSGNSKFALSLMDSLLMKFTEYAIVKETFCTIVTFNVLNSDLMKTNAKLAKEQLLRAYEIDSSNAYINRALAYVYHETAMAKVREFNLYAAREIILEGLKHLPNSAELKEDLSIIEKQIRNNRSNKK